MPKGFEAMQRLTVCSKGSDSQTRAQALIPVQFSLLKTIL